MRSKIMIPWHPLFNRWLKSNLTPADVDYNDEVYATSEPVEIDAVLRHEGPKWSQQQQALLPDGIRNRQKKYHLLEFKITESVNIDGIEQAFSYDYLYRKSQNLSKSQLQTYMVSAKTPRAATLEKWGYKATGHPGVYVSPEPLFYRVNILVLNELRDVPHNQYFRLFASRKKVRESALEYLIEEHERAVLADQNANNPEGNSENRIALNSDQLNEKWNVLLALRRIYGLEGIRMDIEMTLEDVLEMGRQESRKILELFSIQERLAGLEPQEIAKILEPQELLAGLEPQERLAGLEPQERLAGLEPQERLAGLEPQERLAGLEPRERMAGLKPQEIVDVLDPQERVAGLEPQEIVEALEPEDRIRLMQEIENFLANQNMIVMPEEDEMETEELVKNSPAAN